MQSEAGALVLDNDFFVYAVNRPPARLELGAGINEDIDKRLRGAIHSGRLGSIELHETIVDPEPRERCENMLDEPDLMRRLAERSSAVRSRHICHASGDVECRPEVGADKNDTGRRRSGEESQPHEGARQKADSLYFCRPGDGSLRAEADLSHFGSPPSLVPVLADRRTAGATRRHPGRRRRPGENSVIALRACWSARWAASRRPSGSGCRQWLRRYPCANRNTWASARRSSPLCAARSSHCGSPRPPGHRCSKAPCRFRNGGRTREPSPRLLYKSSPSCRRSVW